jgi:hypothetical protein
MSKDSSSTTRHETKNPYNPPQLVRAILSLLWRLLPKSELRALKHQLAQRIEMVRDEVIHDLRQFKNNNASERLEMPSNLESSGRVGSNQGLGWRLTNFFSGSGDSQGPTDREIIRLRTAMAEKEKEIQNLRCELSRLEQVTAEQEKRIQTQTAEFSSELEELKSKAFLRAPKVSDTEITAKWKALCFSIRQFISSYLSGQLDPPTLRLWSNIKNSVGCLILQQRCNSHSSVQFSLSPRFGIFSASGYLIRAPISGLERRESFWEAPLR